MAYESLSGILHEIILSREQFFLMVLRTAPLDPADRTIASKLIYLAEPLRLQRFTLGVGLPVGMPIGIIPTPTKTHVGGQPLDAGPWSTPPPVSLNLRAAPRRRPAFSRSTMSRAAAISAPHSASARGSRRRCPLQPCGAAFASAWAASTMAAPRALAASIP